MQLHSGTSTSSPLHDGAWVHAGRSVAGHHHHPQSAVRAEAARPVRPSEGPIPTPLAPAMGVALHAVRRAYGTASRLFDAARRGERLSLTAASACVDELLATLDGDGQALPALVRLKPPGDYACMHSVAVATLMACLAGHLGLTPAQRRQAALAGYLHDIGKALVPSAVLQKPGRLTDEELTLVRLHPSRGHQILEEAGLDAAAKDVALHHHERMDGRGYPHGQPGCTLTLWARMGAVCDVYDAITSDRPYKAGWDPAEALERMDHWADGGQFDRAIMSAFMAMIGPYPIGSLVRLRTQRLAVVNAGPRAGAGAPSVTVFHCAETDTALRPRVLDLASASADDAIEARESNDAWGFADLDALWAGNVQALRAIERASLDASALRC